MKLFKDILTNPINGKYSRKSVYAMVTLLTAMILAGIALYRDIDPTLANGLVWAFLTTFGALLGFTVLNKKIDK